MRFRHSFAAAAALLWSGTALAGPAGWTMSESRGTVTVLIAGQSKVAVTGGNIPIGATVATGRNGRAVLVRGEEYAVVSPNSRLRVADPAPSGGLVQMFTDWGNAVFRIKKKSTQHFAVGTPYLAAVVKGTTFSVTVSDSGASVQVMEGAVEVATNDGGASRLVTPGMIGFVSAENQSQLVVDGLTRETVEGGKQTPAPAPSPTPAPTDSPRDAAPAPISAPAGGATDTIIAQPVTEGPVALSQLSGGLVSGDSSMNATLAASQNVQQTVLTQMAINTTTAAMASGSTGNAESIGIERAATEAAGNASNSASNAVSAATASATAPVSGASNAGGNGLGLGLTEANGNGNNAVSTTETAASTGAAAASTAASASASASSNAGGNGNGLALGLSALLGNGNNAATVSATASASTAATTASSNAGGNGNGLALGLTTALGNGNNATTTATASTNSGNGNSGNGNSGNGNSGNGNGNGNGNDD